MWGVILFTVFFTSISLGGNTIPRPPPPGYGPYPPRDNYAPADKYMSPADRYKAPTSPAGYRALKLPPIAKNCPRRSTSPDCIPKPIYTCQYDSKYRTYEGECNNPKYPSWGAANTVYRRLLDPYYADGKSEPVGADPSKKPNGYSIPSARVVSNICLASEDDTKDNLWTQFLFYFAQFSFHDITLSGSGENKATFAGTESTAAGTPCENVCEYSEPCFGIAIPYNDPKYATFGQCLPLVRSAPSCEIGVTDGRSCMREQINEYNSYYDASVIYGQDNERVLQLRDEYTGKLKEGVPATSYGYSSRKLLPTNLGVTDLMCMPRSGRKEFPCFEAGDSRVNENAVLTTIHIIFFREHNRIAEILKILNPHWTGIKVFEETRKIIAALLQIFTYERLLPIIIGYEGMKMLGSYSGYKSNVNAGVSNSLNAAAMRFGHGLMYRKAFALPYGYDLNSAVAYDLEDLLFNPETLHRHGTDPLTRGSVTTRAKEPEPRRAVSKSMREYLFEIKDSAYYRPGSDLAAINIQRGREHGLQPYVKYVEACGLGVVTEWEDLLRLKLITKYEVLGNLTEVYGTPANIDLFAGGILEDTLPDSVVGPTFRCIIVDGFQRIRDGDRFWHENNQFSPAQLRELKKYTLEHLICANTDIGQIPRDVFRIQIQPYLVDCSTFKDMDFYHWREKSYGGYQGGPNGYGGGANYDNYRPSTQYNSGPSTQYTSGPPPQYQSGPPPQYQSGPSPQYGPGPYGGPQQAGPGPYGGPQQAGPGPYGGPQQAGPGPWGPQQAGPGPYSGPQQAGPGPYSGPPQQYGPGPTPV